MSSIGSFDLSQLRDAFLSALTDQNRLLSGQLSGLEVPLNIQRLEGSEGVDEGLSYTLDLLAQTQAAPQSLLGKWVHVELKTQDATRTFSALIIGAKKLGAQGILSRYHLTLGTGLDALRHRKTWRVFLNQTALQICESIIQEHKSKNPILAESFFIESHLLKTLPERPFVMQAGESDADFMRRILARDGIHWIIDPSQKGKHTWHLFDDIKALDDIHKQKPVIAFHNGNLVENEDVLTSWEHRGEVQGQSISSGRWNHEEARFEEAVLWKEEGQANPSPFGESLEQYTYTGEEANLQQHAQMQMDSLESPAIHACGPVRHLAAGQVFVLRRNPFLHPGDEKGHRIISWRFRAENNLPHALSEAFHLPFANENPTGKTPFEAEFHCIGAQKVLPVKIWEAPQVGMLSAKAVGPKNQAVYTDALGRIRVRFLFTRPEEHPQGGASDTDADSAWVRFSQPWASEGFGALFLPRAGDEVLVGFLQNDPDQPIIMGGLYNERNWPASFTKSSVLPGDAAISGFRSRMLPGGEGGQATNTGNELLLDDTANELRARLASDHADSQLNLGAIVAPRRQGQAQPRGDGFELKTQDSGAMRAHKGLLLSTESADAKAPQLEVTSLTSKLEGAQSLTQALKEACENHQALPPDEKPLQQDIQELQALQEKKSAKLPAFSKPHLTLDSSADILSAAQNQHHVATENIALNSGKDTQLSTGGRILMAAKEAFSLFAAKIGIKIFAGKGNVEIQAHEGQIGIIADQNVKVTSCQKTIKIESKESLTLVAAGTLIELKDGNITIKCPGNMNVKSAKVKYDGPENTPLIFPELPKSDLKNAEFSNRSIFVNHVTGKPLAKVPYEICTPDGLTLAKGVTDAQGRTERWKTPKTSKPSILWIGKGNWSVSHERNFMGMAGFNFFEDEEETHSPGTQPNQKRPNTDSFFTPPPASSWDLFLHDPTGKPIPDMGVWLKIGGKELKYKSNSNGTIGGLPHSFEPVTLHVEKQDGSKKQVAEIKPTPGTPKVCVGSPKVRVETSTRVHQKPSITSGSSTQKRSKSKTPGFLDIIKSKFNTLLTLNPYIDATTKRQQTQNPSVKALGQGNAIETRNEKDHPIAVVGLEEYINNLKLGVNEEYRSALISAAKRVGMPPQVLAAIVSAESDIDDFGKWKKDSKCKAGGSAAGMGQFKSETWIDRAKSPDTYLFEIAKSRGYLKENVHTSKTKNGTIKKRSTWEIKLFCESKVLNLRFEPEIMFAMIGQYGHHNLSLLKKHGFKIDSANLTSVETARLIYLCHFRGATGATNFISNKFTESGAESTLRNQGITPKALKSLLHKHNNSHIGALKDWYNKFNYDRINPNQFAFQAKPEFKGRSISEIIPLIGGTW